MIWGKNFLARSIQPTFWVPAGNRRDLHCANIIEEAFGALGGKRLVMLSSVIDLLFEEFYFLFLKDILPLQLGISYPKDLIIDSHLLIFFLNFQLYFNLLLGQSVLQFLNFFFQLFFIKFDILSCPPLNVVLLKDFLVFSRNLSFLPGLVIQIVFQLCHGVFGFSFKSLHGIL